MPTNSPAPDSSPNAAGPGHLSVFKPAHQPTTNAAHYARIVVEHASLRRLVAAGSDIAELAYNTPADVDATIDTTESILYTAAHRRNTTPTTTLTKNLSATLDRLEQLYEGHTVAGAPTGYLDYDTLTGGLHPGELTVIGARPGDGQIDPWAWYCRACCDQGRTTGVAFLA